MPPRIRPARSGDVPALAALARRTWLDAFGDSVAPEDAAAEATEGRSERRFARVLAERAILVAEESGELVGYAEVGAVDIPEIEARAGDVELHRLYVESALHGRGIGRALLAAALAHPNAARASRVFLQVWERNERALRLYERAGFRRFGSTRFRFGSEVVEDLVLVLER